MAPDSLPLQADMKSAHSAIEIEKNARTIGTSQNLVLFQVSYYENIALNGRYKI